MSHSPRPLVDELFERPQRFSLVQVTRLLHVFFGASMRYQDFLVQRVRIRPHLSLAFPPHDVVDLCWMDGDGRPLREPDPAQTPRFLLTVSILGLYGAASPLPTFYVEDLLAEEREDLSAGRDFLDIVNSRFYELFLHAGWFRYRPMYAIAEQGERTLAQQMMALGGLGGLTDTDDDSVLLRKRSRILPFIGLLTLFPRSAMGLQAFLRGLFGCACTVLECADGLAPVPADQRCRLGLACSALGEDCVLGRQMHDRTGRIRVCLRRLDHGQMVRLSSPGGRALILEAVAFYCPEPLETDILLSMDTSLLGEARLGASGNAGASWNRLGQDTWLGTGGRFHAGDDAARPEGAGRAFLRGALWR